MSELEAAKSGNREARERLIAAYRLMVVKAARRMLGRCREWLELEDLVSVGLLAVNQCITRFDPTKGTRFSWYAGNQVRYAMQKEIGKLEQRLDIDGTADVYEEDYNTRPAIDIDSEIIGYHTVEGASLPLVSSSAEDRAVDRMFWKQALAECLNYNEREVIRGVIWNRLSQSDVAEQMCMTKQQVNAIYQRALSKLKGYLIEHGLTDVNAAIPVLK